MHYSNKTIETIGRNTSCARIGPYIAVTYDVCEHNDLCESMNAYILDLSCNLSEQIMALARKDVAPLVKVFESNTRDFKEKSFYRAYTFKAYECHCDVSHE